MSEINGASSTAQKALAINLDRSIYGTFAEIGAGQEVARNFFRAGGAAGTIAKSMSAYDMLISDEIYGKASRYVSKDRLETMLGHELQQNIKRLKDTRGKTTRFFSFANTVAAKSYKGNNDCHGWLGVAFQDSVGSEISQVILHVELKDRSNQQQQEVIGIIGVNLIFASFNYANSRPDFISALLENLTNDRIEIDMIDIKGKAFLNIDKHLFCLDLVKADFCQAVMFDSHSNIVEIKDELYAKNILLCRGSYRPPTKLNMDMLEQGKKSFMQDLDKKEWGNILMLPEISMNRLLERGEVDNQDFLARVRLISKLGYPVLISNFKNSGDLSFYISSKTKKQTAIVIGYYSISEIFSENTYVDKPDGLLGGIGKLMGQRTSVYCYPAKNIDTNKILYFEDATIDQSVSVDLFKYLSKSGRLKNIETYEDKLLHIWPRKILQEIQQGSYSWKDSVDDDIVKYIEEEKLFKLK